MKTKLTLFLLLITGIAHAQNQFSLISVHIKESKTELPIKNVSIQVKEINKTFRSENTERIKMALVPGSYTFLIEQENHQSSIENVVITVDTSLVFTLKPFLNQALVEEVKVVEKKHLQYNKVNSSLTRLEAQTLQTLPVMAGEKDLVKTLALLPGMQTTSEGSANLVVRGGNPDQNLFLMNGIPLYQMNHFFSMVSAINPQVVQNVDVYKSAFPAKYGGRVSSVIDIQSKTPSMDSIYAEGDIGLISSKAVFSAPIIKNKLGILASARRTYLDLAARPFMSSLGNVTFNFTDFSFQADWKISKNSTLNLFNYYSRDNYIEKEESKIPGEKVGKNKDSWNNIIAGINYLTKTEKIQNKLSIGYSGYGMNMYTSNYPTDDSIVSSNLKSSLKNVLIKNSFNYEISEKVQLHSGMQMDWFAISPATFEFNNNDHKESSYTEKRIDNQPFKQAALWASANFQHKKWKAELGFRENACWGSNFAYWSFEPRANLLYEIPGSASIKASYGKASQALHMLSNNGLGTPVDLWLGTTEKRKPIVSHQFSLGYFKTLEGTKNLFEFSVEGYYKTMRNMISYQDGYSSSYFTKDPFPLNSKTLPEILATGNGTSYGLEFLFEKKTGRFNGWISYTLSKSLQQFSQFENGTTFNSRYDRPHNLALVGRYKISDKWDFNFSFNLLSGQPFTAPIGAFSQMYFDLLNAKPYDYNFKPIYINSERNGIRLKTFHKLDIGFRKQLKSRRNFEHWLEFGAYNVYCRSNSTYGYIKDNLHFNNVKIVSVSLFPIIPSINYGFKF